LQPAQSVEVHQAKSKIKQKESLCFYKPYYEVDTVVLFIILQSQFKASKVLALSQLSSTPAAACERRIFSH
jgi:hypothetical protein